VGYGELLKEIILNKTYLYQKLGHLIQKALSDDDVNEIMVNPDGDIWAKHAHDGTVMIGMIRQETLSQFVHAFAQSMDAYLNASNPVLDARLPFNQERIHITIPPIVAGISLNIRKHPKIIYTLNDYVQQKIISAHEAAYLSDAIAQRKNILVSGSPASGKTTFTNALLDALAKQSEPGTRVLLLEEVQELRCAVKNCKPMKTTDKHDLNYLLWTAMRASPERIIVGEVRDGAALALLKAWNTGCPGGMATIHANSPEAAVQRILDLAMEVTKTPPYGLAAEALDVIVQIEAKPHHSAKRQVTGICEVIGFDAQRQQFQFKTISANDEKEIYYEVA